MGMAEDIAAKVKTKAAPKETAKSDNDTPAPVKRGDRGKAILAAIKHNDAEALEELFEIESD